MSRGAGTGAAELQDENARLRVRLAAVEELLETYEEVVQEQARNLQETNRKLELAWKAADQASRLKSDFVASVSHELRTPLNSIIGFANVMLKKPRPPRDLTFLERIRDNGMHLLGLINQILDLSKIQAGEVDVEQAPVALAPLVRETLAAMEGSVQGKPVELRDEIPAGLAPVVGDATRLKQILINLVGNAVKFTAQGAVTVRVVAVDRQPVRLEVEDTGIGIPPHVHEAVFEPFRQGEGGIARKYGGTGLGLSISRRLAEKMGYRLELKSEVGTGSIFTVVFSADRGVAAASARPLSA